KLRITRLTQRHLTTFSTLGPTWPAASRTTRTGTARVVALDLAARWEPEAGQSGRCWRPRRRAAGRTHQGGGGCRAPLRRRGGGAGLRRRGQGRLALRRLGDRAGAGGGLRHGRPEPARRPDDPVQLRSEPAGGGWCCSTTCCAR
ncbi:MAG: hypothetical protein M0C28_40955, partial [Candidatus Moduliflexus flocculans]|nr:hypothetical protein [Candidatus Moduliflexus flocculans]